MNQSPLETALSDLQKRTKRLIICLVVIFIGIGFGTATDRWDALKITGFVLFIGGTIASLLIGSKWYVMHCRIYHATNEEGERFINAISTINLHTQHMRPTHSVHVYETIQ